MIDEADRDGDGVISEEEFYRYRCIYNTDPGIPQQNRRVH